MLRREFCLRGDGCVLADVFTLVWQILVDASIECGRWSFPEQNSPFALGIYLIPMISWRRLANPTELCYYFVRCPASYHRAEKAARHGHRPLRNQSIKRLILFPDSPALFSFWRALAQRYGLFTLARMKNSLRISVHSYLEIVCRTSNAAHNKEGVSYA